jgi:hypothetical protein
MYHVFPIDLSKLQSNNSYRYVLIHTSSPSSCTVDCIASSFKRNRSLRCETANDGRVPPRLSFRVSGSSNRIIVGWKSSIFTVVVLREKRRSGASPSTEFGGQTHSSTSCCLSPPEEILDHYIFAVCYHGFPEHNTNKRCSLYYKEKIVFASSRRSVDDRKA